MAPGWRASNRSRRPALRLLPVKDHGRDSASERIAVMWGKGLDERTADELNALWVARVAAGVERSLDGLADCGLADGGAGHIVAGPNEPKAHDSSCGSTTSHVE